MGISDVNEICTVQRKSNHRPDPINNLPILLKLSSRNVVAFTTTGSGYNLQGENNDPNRGRTLIYVADILSPWHAFKVTSSKNCVTVLEWDLTGRRLLIADSVGNVQIWIQKDNLISEWFQIYAVNFPSERIIKACFFHNGKRNHFQYEKRDLVLYMEKFSRPKFAPSLRHFGGASADGCCIVTATGLVGAFLIPPAEACGHLNHPTNKHGGQAANRPIQLTAVTESLGLIRYFLTIACISYGKSSFGEGQFRIAVTNGENGNSNKSLLQCFVVTLKIEDNQLKLSSQLLPSFFLYEGAAGKDIKDAEITSINWTTNEDADSLILAVKTSKLSFIELWSLTEQATPVHKLLQTNKTEIFKTIVWSHQTSLSFNTPVADISVSKTFLGFQHVCVSLTDNTIQIFSKDLKRISSSKLSSAAFVPDGNRSVSQIAAHDVTHMGHMMVAVTNNGQICLIKLPHPYQDQPSVSQFSYVVSLFEYCIITGYDACDLFITTRPNILENIVEKLTENFTRQPSSVQQYYYVNFLTMKINLYRLLMSGQNKANDLSSLLTLHSILIAFKSLLRPSDLTSHDKGPIENLAMVLSESVPDVDKVLLNLDAKDFTVEPTTLQTLQQLIQWVADLSLNILSRLPQNKQAMGSLKPASYDISKDIVAINSLRELLVMIRIWGLLNTHCLPVFSRSVENLDILASLFRLLTRLALNPTDPDEILLDECCLLPSQVMIPQLQVMSPVIIKLNSPLLYLNSWPIQLYFGDEPDCLRYTYEPLTSGEASIACEGYVDNIRNLLLGKHPSCVRKCCRCDMCSSVVCVSRTAAMKAWEQRWASNCRCGGFWILQKL